METRSKPNISNGDLCMIVIGILLIGAFLGTLMDQVNRAQRFIEESASNLEPSLESSYDYFFVLVANGLVLTTDGQDLVAKTDNQEIYRNALNSIGSDPILISWTAPLPSGELEQHQIQFTVENGVVRNVTYRSQSANFESDLGVENDQP